MKIFKDKSNFIFIIGFTIAGLIFLSVVTKDIKKRYSVTINRIEKFHNTKIDNEKISSILKLPYPGRGEYELCSLEKSEVSIPVILDNWINADKMAIGSLIEKKENSYEFVVKENDNIYHFRVRDMTIELDREIKLQRILVLGFIILGGVISLITENRKKNKNGAQHTI